MDAALARTPAFGQRFFAEMFRQLPALSANVTFLQWSTQPEHVWAFFDVSGGGFGGQVDPGLEYLIVWGPGGTAEYGSWEGEDQVPPAIDHVRTLVAWVGL